MAPPVLLVLQLQACNVAAIQLILPDAIEEAGVIREVIVLLVVLIVVKLFSQAPTDVETAL